MAFIEMKHSRPPDLKSSSNVSLPFAWITGPATDPSLGGAYHAQNITVSYFKSADIPTVLGSIRRRSNFKRGMNPGRMMEIVAFFWTFSQCLSIDASEYTPCFVRILTDLAIKETLHLP